MALSKVKRSQIATYLNTSTTTGAVYSLVGLGVTTGKIEMGPKVTEETYIHQDTSTTSIDSYSPNMKMEMTAVTTDAVYVYVDNLMRTRATLAAAETDIVTAYYYQSSTTGGYPADRQAVAIQIDDFGGDGGQPAKINYTINYVGDPIPGTFNTGTSAFTPS